MHCRYARRAVFTTRHGQHVTAKSAPKCYNEGQRTRMVTNQRQHCPDSKVHGANMGPTWVLSAPDGPHVDPMNLAIRTGQWLVAVGKNAIITWVKIGLDQCRHISLCYNRLKDTIEHLLHSCESFRLHLIKSHKISMQIAYALDIQICGKHTNGAADLLLLFRTRFSCR